MRSFGVQRALTFAKKSNGARKLGNDKCIVFVNVRRTRGVPEAGGFDVVARQAAA